MSAISNVTLSYALQKNSEGGAHLCCSFVALITYRKDTVRVVIFFLSSNFSSLNILTDVLRCQVKSSSFFLFPPFLIHTVIRWALALSVWTVSNAALGSNNKYRLYFYCSPHKFSSAVPHGGISVLIFIRKILWNRLYFEASECRETNIYIQ